MSWNYNRIKLDIKINRIDDDKKNFSNKNKELDWELVRIVRIVIEHELPDYAKKELGIQIMSKVISFREGSLDVIAIITVISALEGSIQFAQRIKIAHRIKNLVDHLLHHALGRELPNDKFDYDVSITGISDEEICDYIKINRELTKCAMDLEDNLKHSGAVLGTDYSKLDCFKLALEIIKYCRTSDQNLPSFNYETKTNSWT